MSGSRYFKPPALPEVADWVAQYSEGEPSIMKTPIGVGMNAPAILVVEDDPHTRDLLLLILRQNGFETEGAERASVDFLSKDKTTGRIKVIEAKSSATAPLTKGQAKTYPEMGQAGATNTEEFYRVIAGSP